jgi:lambda repressor-like predicted transcriptional regulator
MRVFVSWSGEPSRSIAEALAVWLERVVPQIDTWMSAIDIASGQRWSDEIAKALDEMDFGIVCVTRANQHAPWLIFESGALAKSVAKAKVVPLCIDLPSTDVTGPLAAFQGRALDMEGVKRLVQDLNQSAEKKIPTERLDEVFVARWPKLEAAFAEAIAQEPKSKEPSRTTDDMLREVVDAVRGLQRTLPARPWQAFETPRHGNRMPESVVAMPVAPRTETSSSPRPPPVRKRPEDQGQERT